MPRAHSSNNAVAMTPLEPLQVRKPPTRKMKRTFPYDWYFQKKENANEKNKKLISQKIPRIGLLQEAKLISIERKFCFNSKYSEKIVKYKKCKKNLKT